MRRRLIVRLHKILHTLEYRGNTGRMSTIWAAYMATYLTPEESRLAADLGQQLNTLVNEGLVPAQAAALGDKLELAGGIYREKVSPLAQKVQSSFNQLVKLQTDVAKQAYEDALERYARVRAVALASVVLGVLLAVALGISLVRGISRSLAEAARLTEAVAHGDLSTRIEVRGRDEVAQVLRLLQTMQTQLAQTVGQVRQGADVVSLASVEMAQGNQDLSARTENQASALEEAAASMEELGATVRQNVDTADQANQLARKTSAVPRPPRKSRT